jgi:hypothetical protein
VSRSPERQKHEVVPDEISLRENPREVFEVKSNPDEVRPRKIFRADKVAQRDVCGSA